MKHLISVFLAILIVWGGMTIIADIHTPKVQLLLQKSRPTKFYRIRVAKKIEIKKKKKIKSQKKTKKAKKMITKKTRRPKTIQTEALKEVEKKEEWVDVSELEVQPIVIQKVIPKYPEIARKSEVETQVLLEVIVSEKGRIESAKVVAVGKPGYGFEEAALAAIQSLIYEPILQNGIPVKVKVIYPITFVLIE